MVETPSAFKRWKIITIKPTSFSSMFTSIPSQQVSKTEQKGMVSKKIEANQKQEKTAKARKKDSISRVAL
jgi:hypothetical protein